MIPPGKIDTSAAITIIIALTVLSLLIFPAYFALIYAPVMLSFVFLTRELENGIYLVWMIFISSWISDTFAYLTGVMNSQNNSSMPIHKNRN